ncbi:MAG TPA: NTP transferase domain-containing protein, partial [Archangium sp.]|uniref:cytidylyltransferase domain-containing protein n=1 Tax=Archangium sp. TaxID=1872627 RepID=UPI002EDA2C4D
MTAARTVAVIPARYASTRFPGKPLALIAGRPMVEHVWRRCQEARAFDEVVVATDDARIQEVVGRFGGTAVMTSPDCATGTDRVAEVARARPDVDVWVNVQGDEPLVDPDTLRVLAGLFSDPEVRMGTLVRPLEA